MRILSGCAVVGDPDNRGFRITARVLECAVVRRDPVESALQRGGHIAHHRQGRTSEVVIQPLFDSHVQYPAREEEVRELSAVARYRVDATDSVITVPITDPDVSGLRLRVSEHGAEFLDVQSSLREIELMGAGEQLEEPVELSFRVVEDADSDIAGLQEGDVRTGGRTTVGHLLLEHPIVAKPGQPAVILALQLGLGEELADYLGAGRLDSGREVARFAPVERQVVDEQDVLRPQLGVFDDLGHPRPLGRPIDGGEHELVPQALVVETTTSLVLVVLRTDRIDDSSSVEGSHEIPAGWFDDDPPLAERPGPERLIEVPDDQLDRGGQDPFWHVGSPLSDVGLLTTTSDRSHDHYQPIIPRPSASVQVER